MTELLGAVGYVKSIHTLVDFYQYIKAVEYLICLAFFVSFPMFYRYLNKIQPVAEKTSH
ncbi:MAG: hypothetical protein PHH91_03145 [Desulfuromonadaceae bacterium]|jgi:hypothetical protein|nr:hypothetical protein [Desulfuromonadaceae bacterium]